MIYKHIPSALTLNPSQEPCLIGLSTLSIYGQSIVYEAEVIKMLKAQTLFR